MFFWVVQPDSFGEAKRCSLAPYFTSVLYRKLNFESIEGKLVVAGTKDMHRTILPRVLLLVNLHKVLFTSDSVPSWPIDIANFVRERNLQILELCKS